MAIVEMQRLSLIGLEKDKEQILEHIMKMGVIHEIDVTGALDSEEWASLVEKDGDSEGVAILESMIEKVDFAIKYLTSYDKRKAPLFSVKREISSKELESIIADSERLRSVIDKVAKYDGRLIAIKAEKNKYYSLIAALEPWKNLDLPLETEQTRSTAVVLGFIPAFADLESMMKELETETAESYIKVVEKDGNQVYLLLIYHKAVEDEISQILKKYGFSKISFKDMKGTAEENIKNASDAIELLDKESREIEKELAALAEEKDNLEAFYDFLVMKRDRKASLQKLARTEQVFILEGWIPKYISREVSEIISRSWDCVIEIRDPGEDEEYPILLHNGELGKVVEPITEMYSLPNHKEFDPNSIMAPFFILFFGLMLGDGGYGALMSAVIGLLLWKVKMEQSTRKFMKLMLYCGLSTTFWGALFGSWFGIEALSNYALWFNPVSDPELLLLWALVFGVVHIYVGIGARAVNLIKHKKYVDIIYDVLVWYIFFTGFILIVLPYLPKIDPDKVTDYVQVGKSLLIAGAVLLILTQGRNNKNIILRLLGGTTKIYDLVSFMSDVLSYSRLMAMGLATSVIASIVNQMAAMIGFDSIVKILVFILVVIVGHAFNFAINALGAYVHSSRLQYIEFFGKFYEGGGKAFEPLKINSKYISIKN